MIVLSGLAAKNALSPCSLVLQLWSSISLNSYIHEPVLLEPEPDVEYVDTDPTYWSRMPLLAIRFPCQAMIPDSPMMVLTEMTH